MRRNNQRSNTNPFNNGSFMSNMFDSDPFFGGSFFSQTQNDSFFNNSPFNDPFFSSPFDDPFFTRPFGFSSGPSLIQNFLSRNSEFSSFNQSQAMHNRPISGPGHIPMIEEVPEDHPLFDSDIYVSVHNQPLIEHPDEEIDNEAIPHSDSTSDMEGMIFSDSNEEDYNRTHSRTFQTSSVSYSVNNGDKVYTSYVSQKRGPSGEIEIEDYEYDSTKPEASKYQTYSNKSHPTLHSNQESNPQLTSNNFYYIEDEDDQPQPQTRGHRSRSSQRRVRNIDVTWN